jgi:arylsulfatase
MKKSLFFVLTIFGLLTFLRADSLHRAEAPVPDERPNIIFILVDDMGWSDLGAYGGEIQTPRLDALAQQGLRFTQAYNTAKCFPSRACLLTGIYAQQSDMDRRHGAMNHAVTLGEVLRSAGYRTLASGKHHGTENLYDRGFDHYYGLRDGASNLWNPGKQREGEPPPGNKGRVRVWCDDATTYRPYTPEDPDFYATDAFTDKALGWLDEEALEDKPFFLYLAYTAPHYPLHAWPRDIEKYEGFYDKGYEAIREARYERMVASGLIDPEKNPLPEWEEGDFGSLSGIDLEKEKRRMEIYAAMLDRVDQNIGRVLDQLEAQGKLENTIIFFASDNGGCAEASGARQKSDRLEDFGTVASYETVGRSWATVQNTPLRMWKNYSQEGGIRTPLIVSWPARIQAARVIRAPVHFIDIMPTLVELTGAEYPGSFKGQPITRMQGVSLLPLLDGGTLSRDQPLYWQWSHGGAIRVGDWKAVFKHRNDWSLHDFSRNQNETQDYSAARPKLLESLKAKWENWYAPFAKRD